MTVARWERLTALVELVLNTGAVAGVRRESLILCGPPGHGKSALLERWGANVAVRVYTDTTLTDLLSCARDAQNGQLTHVIFPELQKLLMRRSAVGDQALGFLAAAMEEGVKRVSLGPITHDFRSAQFGALGAITPDALSFFGQRLRHIGLFSRGLWLPWEMDTGELAAVSDAIRDGDQSALTPCEVNHAGRPRVPVRLSRSLAATVQKLSQAIFPFDVRFQKQLAGLCMASAVREDRGEVAALDVEYVASFADFFRQARRDR